MSRVFFILAVLAVLALFAPRQAHAQLGDSIASASAEGYPRARIGSRGEVTVGVARVSGGFPIFLGKAKRTIVIPTLSYERLELSLEGASPKPATLHAPLVGLTLVQLLGPHVTLVGVVNAGFASDFESSINGDDFVVTATGLGIYKFSEKLSLGAGISYDRRTGSLVPVPILPVNLRFSERARLRGLVPSLVALEYRTSRWLTTGLRASFEGNRYHLSEDKFHTSQLELGYTIINVGPRLSFEISPLLHLDLYAAVPVYRRYAAYIDDETAEVVHFAPVVGYGVRFWVGPSGW